MQMFNFKHVNSTINFDGTVHIPKAKDMLKCFTNNSEEGGKNTHDLYLCYCFIFFFFFIYSLLYGIHYHTIGACQEY